MMRIMSIMILAFSFIAAPIGVVPTFAVNALDCETGNVNPKYLRPGGFCEQLLNLDSLASGSDGGGSRSCKSFSGIANGFSHCYVGDKIINGTTYEHWRSNGPLPGSMHFNNGRGIYGNVYVKKN